MIISKIILNKFLIITYLQFFINHFINFLIYLNYFNKIVFFLDLLSKLIQCKFSMSLFSQFKIFDYNINFHGREWKNFVNFTIINK